MFLFSCSKGENFILQCSSDVESYIELNRKKPEIVKRCSNSDYAFRNEYMLSNEIISKAYLMHQNAIFENLPSITETIYSSCGLKEDRREVKLYVDAENYGFIFDTGESPFGAYRIFRTVDKVTLASRVFTYDANMNEVEMPAQANDCKTIN